MTKEIILMFIVPTIFIVFLFIGCKIKKIHEWNDNFLCLNQINYIRGFCAIGVLLHHVSLVAASNFYGFEHFADFGYIFVGLFLFTSGYGLYINYKNKENYFKGYFVKRFLPIGLAFLTTSFIFVLYKGVLNYYAWYIYALSFCYILFYIGFKFIKNEHISLLIVLIGIIGYCTFCWIFKYGIYWYITIGMFFVGLIFAKYEKYIVNIMKKRYLFLTLITFALMLICIYYGKFFVQVCNNYGKLFIFYNMSIVNAYKLYSVLFRFTASLSFTLLLLFVSLKVEFGNPILLFYNSISLEFFLIQELFVNMFGPYYIKPSIESLYYIKNVPLLLFVCFVTSTISGLILHRLHKNVLKKIKSI